MSSNEEPINAGAAVSALFKSLFNARTLPLFVPTNLAYGSYRSDGATMRPRRFTCALTSHPRSTTTPEREGPCQSSLSTVLLQHVIDGAIGLQRAVPQIETTVAEPFEVTIVMGDEE